MSYADAYPYLVQSFDRIQGAQRSVVRLPECDKRQRVIDLLAAAEAALNELDGSLLPDAAADNHDEHDTKRHPECRFCWPIASESEAAQ